MIRLKIEDRQRRRRKLLPHQRQFLPVAGSGEPGCELREARIMADGEQCRDPVRGLPQNLEQLVDSRKINRILDQMRDMAWKRRERLIERLLGATRIGGDGEARNNARIAQELSHPPGILNSSAGERTFAIAAGRMPVGLAMAQEQETTHAASLSRRRRAATDGAAPNAGCDETTRLFTLKAAPCKLLAAALPKVFPMRKSLAARVVMALCLAGFAAPSPGAGDGPLTLDNIVLTLGAATYSIPHMEIDGASLPPTALAALLRDGDADVPARLARISARRIAVPAMSRESRTNERVERAAYRKLIFENVVSGRAATVRGDGGEETIESAKGVQRVSWGASTAKGVDLAALARLTLATRSDAHEPLKPLVDEEIVESSRLEDAGANLVVTTGRLRMQGVRGRPLQTPARALINRLEKLDPSKPEDDAAAMRDLLDALLSFEAASIDIDDVVAAGNGEPAGKPFTAKFAHAGMRKVAGAGAGEIGVDDFSLAASDGSLLSIKRLALSKAQFAPLLQGGAYPKLARVEMRGLAADIPDPKTSETSRLKFRVENASANFGNFLEATPTKFSGRLDKFIIDLAARGETPATAHFLALGYRELAFSGFAAGEWREKTSEAELDPVVVDATNMGVAHLTALFGNVSRAAFSSSPVISSAATLVTSVKSIDLTLEGGGLVDRVLALEAKEQKMSVEKARADYAKAAATAINALGGAGANAKRIADAVSAYIEKPKRLHLRFVAPKGVNAIDVLARKPSDILESLEVEASADR